MQLLLDLGNTRLKWAQSAPGEWRTGAVAYRGQDLASLLEQVWADIPQPERVAMVNVVDAGTVRALERWIERRWNVGVQDVKPAPQQLGVINRYRDPGALGADRWAALIGAHAELPGTALAVIGCGTAVTVDALTAAGEFAGGVIFPGLALQRSSLFIGTAAVRAVPGDETSCLARATADAVAAGTLYGVVGAIERICRELELALGEPLKCLVTGGDADRIGAHLNRPARRQPDLVLRGLARIADSLC